MKLSAIGLVSLVLAAASPAPAQEKKDPAPSPTYKIEFRIKDGSDAASKNGRRYAMVVNSGSRGALHLGDRVPVSTGSFQPGVGGQGINPLVNTQWNYLDVGVNIEAKLWDLQGRVLIDSTIDLSTIVPHKADASMPAVASQPTVAQIKIAFIATVTPGKPSLVALIDDPATERKFDVEALVTKVE